MRECIIVPMLRRSTPKKVPQEFPCEPMDCVVRLTVSAFIRSTRIPATRKPVVKRALDWGICECGAPSDCSPEAAVARPLGPRVGRTKMLGSADEDSDLQRQRREQAAR